MGGYNVHDGAERLGDIGPDETLAVLRRFLD
jgi:hypothetical protein